MAMLVRHSHYDSVEIGLANTVVDRYDFQLSFYKDVESIIRELVENDVKIIA